MKKTVLVCSLFFLGFACSKKADTTIKNTITEKERAKPFIWQGANVYFLLTDRFHNGNPTNDVNFERTKTTGKLRGFQGGDIQGITQKIKEGYFTNLGINVIWMTPIVEQIHGAVDEGTGATYGFHGYWTKDWTTIDPNFGTKEALHELVQTAHERGIKILLDAVINHTGPVTEKDSVWPASWVRTEPQCTYDSYENTISCTLVKNLPDIKTESNEAVELHESLIEKWKNEGRYEQEVAELDAFFEKTGYPRAPRFYIMKWLADYIEEFGIDGYRVDTVKHVEENVWQEFKKVCDAAFENYKKQHPANLLDTQFYLVGEVYGYGISGGKMYNFGDRQVNYFDKAFTSLINFEFKWNAKQLASYEDLFSRYDSILQNKLKGYGVLNYMSSHDDGQPFDVERKHTLETATKLLLAPGTSQVYYGDEIARPLAVEGAEGDANLRSPMEWEKVKNDSIQRILTHWQKLGQFRAKHPAIGAGKHEMISKIPYVFKRSYKDTFYTDEVLIGLGMESLKKELEVSTVFIEGEQVKDFYSGKTMKVEKGKVTFESPFEVVLLEKYNN